MITIEKLSKSFGSFYALRNITLQVNAGEFWTIVGPNGAGKTTLLKIIATLSHPTSGSIRIDGTLSTQNRPDIRSRIGFIGHQTFLYDNLTAAENLIFYARMYRLDNIRHRINTILEQVGLLNRKDDLVRTFSRGMQQRLSIGRALLTDPGVVLLDEPFSGLDQNAIESFVKLFTSLISPERIIIMTTHNLELALQLASHFVVLANGRIVEQGDLARKNIAEFRALYRRVTGENR